MSFIYCVIYSFIWWRCTTVECRYWWSQAWVQWPSESSNLSCIPWWNTIQLTWFD